MSAIWGYLSYTNSINDSLPPAMEEVYKAKCKIDCYRSQQTANLYMACGIQYITKESCNEVLPVFDTESGIYFTADCILDNRAELISLLSSDPSEPDGTLMFLAYKKWGMDCLKHFRGLFSMAVYDINAGTLFLAADQVSSRCLYYYKTKDFVCFSTLLDPLRNACPDLAFNEYYLKDFLTAPGLMPNIVPTETPYTGVLKINPGCYMTISPDTVTEHSYWTPFSHKKQRHLTAKAYGKAFRSLYTECVKDALRTDGEVGISMSSGLDSASVGALAADLLSETNQTLYSYTYIPYETPEPDKQNRNHIHDETNDVMKIVDMHPNIQPHFLNNNGKNCLEFISKGLDIMEIPFKAVVNLPNLYEVYYHAQKDGCKIVLTGQTGNTTISHGKIMDILFDSYQNKQYMRFLFRLNRYSKKTGISRKKALNSCLQQFKHAQEVYRYSDNFAYQPDNPFLSDSILTDYPLKERYKEGELNILCSVPSNRDFYRQFLHKKALYTYIGELDTKLGLATGVLIRDSTRDIRLIEFCADLPYHIFANRGTPRWLIRENLRDILPTPILDNWMRFGVQNSDWLLRIQRDFPELSVFIMNIMKSAKEQKTDISLESLIDEEKIHRCISSAAQGDTTFDSSDFFYLNFIIAMFAFLAPT